MQPKASWRDADCAWLRAVLILPFNALITIPGLILWLGYDSGPSWRLAPMGSPWFWLALLLMAGALVLMGWTMTLFTRAVARERRRPGTRLRSWW